MEIYTQVIVTMGFRGFNFHIWAFSLLTCVLWLTCWTPRCVGQFPCNDSIPACQTPIQNLTSSGNLVNVTVSSTCGDPNSTSYAFSDAPRTIQMCFVGNHPKQLMYDTMSQTFGSITVINPVLTTYWQSENSIPIVGANPTPEFVGLNFPDAFLIRSIVLMFVSPGIEAFANNDQRPLAMQIKGWNSVLNQFVTWRYYADNCTIRYPFVPIQRPLDTSFNALSVVCMEKFYANDEATQLRTGSGPQQVAFYPVREYPNDFAINPDVWRHFTTSSIQVQFDYPAYNTPLLSYYAVADLFVEWQCACFGHAAACYPGTGKCICQHNTMGDHCDQCLPLFNQRPWTVGVGNANATNTSCLNCNCNGFSASCRYEPILGYGICDNCTANTVGSKCESCVQYYYVNPNQTAMAPGSTCTALTPPLFQPAAYNCSDRCIPCNCSIGADPQQLGRCDPLSGNCTCKPYVQGRACDVCKDGYWNLDPGTFTGCTACSCEPSGSLHSISFCDKLNSTCICKTYTQGVRCESCQPGYFNLDILNPDGCTLCDCDAGASLSLVCPPDPGGQCACKSSISGRTCRQPFPGFFGPSLDYLTFDAEFSPNVTASDIVERYGAGDVNATDTGRGFVNLTSQRSLLITLNVPFTSLFTLIVRYETPALWPAVQANVQLQGSPVPSLSCGTGATYQPLQSFTLDFQPKATAGSAAMGTVCLLANTPFSLRLTFPSSNPPNLNILVDSVVLMPDLSTSAAFQLLNSSLKAQTTQCAQVQQSVNVPAAQNFSCPQLGYSIMVDKFSGAVACACNPGGTAAGAVCNPLGGQCTCLPNVFLRDCSQCKVNSYGFTPGIGCTQCNCDPNGSMQSACNQTGGCLCRPNVVGIKCNTCIPQYWGVFTGNGCQPCTCNAVFAVNNSCMDSGQCYCLPGVAGQNCDRCDNGYYRLTTTGCTYCGCSFYGSQTIQCDPSDGHCICKAQTVGFTCNTCQPGYYALGPWGNDGCIRCYCSGHSNNCSSAFGWYQTTVNTTLGLKDGTVIETYAWTAEYLNGSSVPTTYPTLLMLDGSAIHVTTVTDELNGTMIFFVAPNAYLGDKRTAYGQNLSLTMLLTLPSASNTSFVPIPADGDVFIAGNLTSYTLVTSFPSLPGSIIPTTYSLRLHESVWFLNSSTSATKVQATYEQMLQVLSSIESVKVRAAFLQFVGNATNTTVIQTSLVTASLAFATPTPTAGNQILVNNVEDCMCPPGYVGQFCESCALGYTRSNPAAGMFSECIPCFCNNHAVPGTFCNPDTGACTCMHNTTGTQCQICQNGYYGYPPSGRADSCQPCMCPGNVVTPDINVFASSCHNDGAGGFICDNCTQGTTGTHCEQCGDGFFGTPNNTQNNNGHCTMCRDPTYNYCHGNAGYNQTCDHITGACLNCTFNTAGKYCDTCMTNFYGKAVLRQCQPCNCNSTIGMTGDCDKLSGACFCKDNVTSSYLAGARCDACLSGWFNFSNSGCQACNCFQTGSYSSACDPVNGTCTCQYGFTGPKCDTCIPGKWNPMQYCPDCQCDPIGTATNGSVCNPVTGQCPCNPGFAGRLCNICQAGKNATLPYIGDLSLGTYPNCTSCDSCYDSIAGKVSQIGVNMETSYIQLITLWSTSFNNLSLDYINAQIQMIDDNVSYAYIHIYLIGVWVPVFQNMNDSFMAIMSNYTLYSGNANFYNFYISILYSSLSLITPWTGSVAVSPTINTTAAQLAQQLAGMKIDQDSKFNYSTTLYRMISYRIGIMINVGSTIDQLRARVSAALSVVASSRATRNLAEVLLNASMTLNIDTLLFRLSDQANQLQQLNSATQTSVNQAAYFQGLANDLILQMSNMTLNFDAVIYNRTGDAQNLRNLALSAQAAANNSLAAATAFQNAAIAAKQSISGNIIALATALKTLAGASTNLSITFVTANTILSTSLDAYTSLINSLAQQIANTTVAIDKVAAINNMAQQSLQLATAAQNTTQIALAKAQAALALLNAIQANVTSTQLLQQTAQNGLNNATNMIAYINSVIFTVSQKASNALALASSTNDKITNILAFMTNMQQTYPQLAARLKTARSLAEFVNLNAGSLYGILAGVVNMSTTLQVNINVRLAALAQQKIMLQNIKIELDSMFQAINDLTTAYNLPALKQESDNQVQDIRTLNNDLTLLGIQLDQLNQQLNLYPPNSTSCIVNT